MSSAFGSELDGTAAMIALNSRIKADPKNAQLYIERGKFYDKNFDFDLAIADMTHAIELKPSATAYAERARVYQNEEKFDLALADFEKAAVLDPKDQSVFSDLGALEEELHNYEKAVVAFSRLLALNPNRCVERTHRAGDYLSMHKPAEALKDLQLVLKLDPDRRGAIHEVLGSVYMELKQYDKAVQAFDIAIARENMKPKALAQRAEAYDKLNKPELAKRDRVTLKNLQSEVFGEAPFRTKP